MSPRDNLAALADAQYEGQQMIAEGRVKGWPIFLVMELIKAEMRRKGLIVPEDLLAWLFDGQSSDRLITDPLSPVGM